MISRRPGPSAAGGVRWIRADLADRDGLADADLGAPEIVIHMAAITHSRDPARYEAVNVRGTEHLLATLGAGPSRRFIHVSTRAIGVRGGAYSASKERAEAAVKQSGELWTILRPGEVYGSGGADPILRLAADLRRRRMVPILGDGTHTLCPVFVGDVVEAIVRATTSGAAVHGTYVLAGPDRLSYRGLVERLESIQGLPRRRRIFVPVAMARIAIGGLSLLGIGPYVPDQIPRLLLEKSDDIAAAVRDLGFSPRSLNEALPSLLGAGLG